MGEEEEENVEEEVMDQGEKFVSLQLENQGKPKARDMGLGMRRYMTGWG